MILRATAGRRAITDGHRHLLTESVQAVVTDCYALLEHIARVKTNLPVIAARFAEQRLTAAAQTRGAIVSTVPEVLFVCVHNAGRSQMAAALLDHHAAGRVHVRSAGSAPAAEINPAVAVVMAEVDLDLTKEFPKPKAWPPPAPAPAAGPP